jgi:predicted DCC family thiol-disulfide oxidoreductase YuxK
VAHLLLYDGVCGLCNRLTQFVVRHDRANRFRYASLQGAVAGELLRRHDRDPRDLDTVYVVAHHGEPGEQLLWKSRAILFVLAQLGGVWGLGRVLGILPRRLLDRAYDGIARRRYRWFGKYDTCPLPPPGVREKFLDAQA